MVPQTSEAPMSSPSPHWRNANGVTLKAMSVTMAVRQVSVTRMS